MCLRLGCASLSTSPKPGTEHEKEDAPIILAPLSEFSGSVHSIDELFKKDIKALAAILKKQNKRTTLNKEDMVERIIDDTLYAFRSSRYLTKPQLEKMLWKHGDKDVLPIMKKDMISMAKEYDLLDNDLRWKTDL